MNLSLLKQRAKIINKESRNPSIYIGSVIYLIVIVIMSSLVTRLSTPALTTEETEQLISEVTSAIQSGRYEYASSLIPQVTPASSTIASILQILMQYISIGFSLFVMNIVRKNGAVLGNLLDGFQMPIKVFLLNFLRGIFAGLWMLLFIFPGIAAIYSYRLAPYILLDHPDWSAMQCIRASKQMMKGHKWDLFRLDLSFLGWAVLGVLVVPVKIYTLAYTESTYVLFYQQLAGIHDSFDANNIFKVR